MGSTMGELVAIILPPASAHLLRSQFSAFLSTASFQPVALKLTQDQLQHQHVLSCFQTINFLCVSDHFSRQKCPFNHALRDFE